MDNRRWNIWPPIDVGVQGELALHVQRAMHVPRDDGVLVLFMVSTMNDLQGDHRQCCTNAGTFYQCQ
jgi:hypothetical protein